MSRRVAKRLEVEERLAAFELHVAPEKTAVLRFDGNLLHGTADRQSNRRPSPSLVSSTLRIPGLQRSHRHGRWRRYH